MRKLCAVLLSFAMLFASSSDAFAGKGGGSSRSFSSGGSSRSSFSSGSRSTFSSGSGKTYSSPKPSSPPSSSGKSFSSGSKPTPPSNSGKSFSGGSKPTPPSTGPPSSGKSYSSGNSSKGYSGDKNASIKPGKSSFDSLGGKEQMKAESRATYQKSQAPKNEYKTASGKTVSIDPKDAKIANLRSQLSQERWVNRESRQVQFYGVYYSRPIVVYHDPYPSFFWWWMLDRSLEERAIWAYHHRQSMDQARYQAMVAKDAQLEARIRQLETQGVRRDPTYAPKGMDPDLMYDNNYVDAVYNPVPPPQPTPPSSSGGGWLFLKILFWIGIFGGLVFLFWFVFVRRS